MALQSRIRELDTRHRDLDAAIEAARRKPSADPLKIMEMKRQKLRLKEEADTLRRQLPH